MLPLIDGALLGGADLLQTILIDLEIGIDDTFAFLRGSGLVHLGCVWSIR